VTSFAVLAPFPAPFVDLLLIQHGPGHPKALDFRRGTVQGRQVPRIQRVHPRSTLVLKFFRQSHDYTFRSAHGLGHCLTERWFDMRVQVVPRFFLSSIQDPVRCGIGPVRHRVRQNIVQDLFSVRIRMLACLIEGGAGEGHEGHLNRFELFHLLIPFGSNDERELTTRNSE
jgi:hypothetical protein